MVLFQDSTPSRDQVWEAESKLLVFGRWLGRSYIGDTVVKYVGDVRRAQHVWVGMPLRAMGVEFYRLPALLRMLRKEKPGKKRQKTPWLSSDFDNVRDGAGGAAQWGLFPGASGKQRHEREMVFTVMLVAFEQLLRLNEVVKTSQATAASRDPLFLSDLHFEDSNGDTVRWRADSDPVVAVLRMPPSKTDITGVAFDRLRMPFPNGWRGGAGPNAAGPALWRYVLARKVPAYQRGVRPLFEVQGHKGQPGKALTETVFRRVFKELCAQARTPVKHEVYGIHCFRVGGMNRLLDLGATAPQICALGRWSSDCLQLYARRQRKALTRLTERMATQP